MFWRIFLLSINGFRVIKIVDTSLHMENSCVISWKYQEKEKKYIEENDFRIFVLSWKIQKKMKYN